MLTGFSPEKISIKAFPVSPTLLHFGRPYGSIDDLWTVLTQRLDKSRHHDQRICTATYSAIESIESEDAATTATKLSVGVNVKRQPLKLQQLRASYREVGLNPDSPQTFKLCGLREIRGVPGDVVRLVHLQSPFVVWRGRLGLNDEKNWTMAMQRAVGMNRLRGLKRLRESMQRQLEGQNHPPFDSWVYFEDFAHFFDQVTVFHDSDKHQNTHVHQRYETEGIVVGKEKRKGYVSTDKHDQRKKNSARVKTLGRQRLASVGSRPDVIGLLVESALPTTMLVTFSAFGSREKFLDGSSLPPGELKIRLADPFQIEPSEVRACSSCVSGSLAFYQY